VPDTRPDGAGQGPEGPAAGLVVVGAWRAPAGLVDGTVVLATGVALLTPAVMTLAVRGVAQGSGAR
jgi:hypothetical protein